MSQCLLFRGAAFCAAAILVATTAADVLAQAPANRRAPPAGFRKLAPGVETTIPAAVDPHDTVAYHNIVELLAPGVVNDLEWTPNYTSPTKTLKSLATDRPYRTTAWYLQFIFKPLRLIQVELPNSKGVLERKVVWYMVYRVKNVGGHLQPVDKPQGDDPLPSAPEVQIVEDPGVPIHFFPHFSFEAEVEGKKLVYADQIIPAAIEAIRKREDPARRLFNTVEIGAQSIKPSTATEDNSVWGVATWVDVDPRIDFFSIYVSGLTNAYRWTDGVKGAGAKTAQPANPGGKGGPIDDAIAKAAADREYKHKTLQLNFWRPGDEFILMEGEIHMGAPADRVHKHVDPDAEQAAGDEKTGAPGRNWEKIIDYRWIFR
jgi:hypothetical protein